MAGTPLDGEGRPVPFALLQAVEQLLPATLPPRADEAASADAFAVLSDYLEEEATGEAVFQARSLRCGRSDEAHCDATQALLRRVEVEGQLDARSPLVQAAVPLLCRLMLGGGGSAAARAAARAQLARLREQAAAAGRETQGDERAAACLRAAALLEGVLGGPEEEAEPEAEASEAEAEADAAEEGAEAAEEEEEEEEAAAAEGAEEGEEVPEDLLAWRWGGAAALSRLLPPAAAPLRHAAGCGLSLVSWLPAEEWWAMASAAAAEAEAAAAEEEEEGSPAARRAPPPHPAALLHACAYAGSLDAATVARHVSELEGEREQLALAAARAGASPARERAPLGTAGSAGSPSATVASCATSASASAAEGGPAAAGAHLPLTLSDVQALVQIVSAGRPARAGGGGGGGGLPPLATQAGPLPVWPQPAWPQSAPRAGPNSAPQTHADASRRAALLAAAAAPPPPSPAAAAASAAAAALPDAAALLFLRLLAECEAARGAAAAAAAAAAVLRPMACSGRSNIRCAAFELLGSLALQAAPPRAWIPALLGQCLLALAAQGEAGEPVWHAAAAAVMLVTAGASSARLPAARAALPPAALRALCDAAQRFGWESRVRSALLRLAARLLYRRGVTPPRLSPRALRQIGGAGWLARQAAGCRCAAARAALLAPLLDCALTCPGAQAPPAAPLPPRLLAAALWRAGGGCAVGALARGGGAGAAAALADGLCAAFPHLLAPGRKLAALAPHNTPPSALQALEALLVGAAAVPEALAAAAAAAAAPPWLAAAGGAPPPQPQPVEWALLSGLLRSAGAGERRDGAAWLRGLLRDWALQCALERGGITFGAARRGSLLPPRDSWLGGLLGEAAKQGRAAAAPPLLAALAEALLLALQPAAAGGEAEAGWAAALETLEDAAERILEAAPRAGGAAAAAAAALAAADLWLLPLLSATPAAAAAAAAAARVAEGAEAAAGPPPPLPPQPPAREWAEPACALLAGEAAVPLPLLQASSLQLHLRLLSSLGGVTPGGGGITPRCADARAALLILLLQRCAAREEELQTAGGEEMLRALASDGDARVAYAAACHLLGRLAAAAPGAYRAGLRRLALRAQRADDERLLDNPFYRLQGLALI